MFNAADKKFGAPSLIFSWTIGDSILHEKYCFQPYIGKDKEQDTNYMWNINKDSNMALRKNHKLEERTCVPYRLVQLHGHSGEQHWKQDP